MDTSAELPNLFSGLCVWLVVAYVLIYKFFFNTCNKVSAPVVNQYSRKPKEFESSLTFVFSSPTDQFEWKDNSITVQLLVKTGFRLLQPFILDAKNTEYNRDFCGLVYIIGYSIVIDNRPMFPIPIVKAVHHNQKGLLFFEGIYVLDHWTGRRTFYSIKEYIRGDIEIKSAPILYVKPQQLILWSKQTFCPSFETPYIQDFGKELVPNGQTGKTADISEENLNGIIIAPKLHWCEATAFYALLFNLTFFTNIWILIIRKHLPNISNNQILFSSIFISGFLSLIVTEILAFVFVNCIKSYYEKNVSNWAKSQSKTSTVSVICKLLRIIYLLIVVIMSIASSVSTQIILHLNTDKDRKMNENFNFDLFESNEVLNEILFLVSIFIASILLTFTLWLLILGFMKYFYRFLTFTPKPNRYTQEGALPKDLFPDLASDTSSGASADSKGSGKKVKRREKKENIDKVVLNDQQNTEPKFASPKSKIEKHMSAKSQSESTRAVTKSKKKRLKFGTEVVEKELKDKKRRNLMTKSIIHEPTEEKGFINPEQFRITESKL